MTNATNTTPTHAALAAEAESRAAQNERIRAMMEEAEMKKAAEETDEAERRAAERGMEFEKGGRNIEAERRAALAMENRDPVTPEEITDAIATLARAMHSHCEPYTANGIEITNGMQFQQRMVVDNIVSNAAWLMKSATERLDEQYRKLDEAEAQFKGSDNEIFQINITLEQIERLNHDIIPTLGEYLPICRAAYRGIMGEDWKPKAKQGKAPKDQAIAALRERIAKARN